MNDENLDATLGGAFEPLAPPPAFEEELLAQLESQLVERRNAFSQSSTAELDDDLVDLEPVLIEDWRQRHSWTLAVAAAAILLIVGGVLWATNDRGAGENVGTDVDAVSVVIEHFDEACKTTLPDLDPPPISFNSNFGDVEAEVRSVQQLRVIVDNLQSGFDLADTDEVLSAESEAWRTGVEDLLAVERLIAAGDTGALPDRVLRNVQTLRNVLAQLEQKGASSCMWQ